MIINELEQREAFHLTFLRILVGKVPLHSVILKGGGNLRFFFNSPRFSEDLDLDVQDLEVLRLREAVMSVLESKALAESMSTFGIERVVPPDLAIAKQTETVQRFKIHLISFAGQDLFTKVEFSRRGVTDEFLSQGVKAHVLGRFHIAPLVLPHYTAVSALLQKLRALLGRQLPQVRDVFDVYILSARPEMAEFEAESAFSEAEREQIKERIYGVSFEEYHDRVVAFLGQEDARQYDSRGVWDEMRLTVIRMLG